MNTAPLKRYAPAARNAFIAAVTAQAAKVGITAKGAAPAKVQGDVMLVGGHAFPARLSRARDELAAQVTRDGFAATMEAAAYTWFNRFAAIRYMEVHGFLGHGHRVLSDTDGGPGRPEILDHAADVDLPGLEQQRAIDLKLAGDQDAELYRLLLLAQCDALHRAMPFLFDRIGHATELLMPANLLHTDSLTREMVAELPDELWQDIEVVGWLYQFYISEKKNQVIGKKVKSEDIPAATQLFTPNWIVKYLVQNSLGAQWLATYPESGLKDAMEYYIEPAEQTTEAQAQLDALTPDSLDPEALTLIDPASGSGHILVEAYDLFKAIYLERGYRLRDVPALVLTKNLYGLDIDRRAAQLTGFALMMKGRADDRRLFERGVALNVLAFENSDGLDVDALVRGKKLAAFGLTKEDVTALKELFSYATTFGSLIQVPEGLAGKLAGLRRLADTESQDLFVQKALARLRVLVRQAEVLAQQYDAVVANPPYMGSKGMVPTVRSFVKRYYEAGKIDLYACFLLRSMQLSKPAGDSALVVMQSWMFLSSFEGLRREILTGTQIRSMAHLGTRAFGSISGEVVQVTAQVIHNQPGALHRPVFLRLTNGDEAAKAKGLRDKCPAFLSAAQADFLKIPGAPLAYWPSKAVLSLFDEADSLSQIGEPRRGLQPGDTPANVRAWQEVGSGNTALVVEQGNVDRVTQEKRWVAFTSGGGFRKWWGHLTKVVNWRDNGADIKAGHNPIVPSEHLYFLRAITWSKVSTSAPSFRVHPHGAIPGDASPFAVVPDPLFEIALASLNSAPTAKLLEVLAPTLNFQVGDVGNTPILDQGKATGNVKALIESAKTDWDAYERSWDFQSLPLLTASDAPHRSLADSYTAWTTASRATIAEMKRLEEVNNRLFIDAYGLQDELAPDVPLDQITLTVNPAHRYGGNLTVDEQWTRFRQDTMEELVSYAIGCMMGRYSLDVPGLVYANAGNQGFDPSQYTTFPVDGDGIIPLTDSEWFGDDAANRVVEFLSVAWPVQHVENNLAFLAENLGPRRGESSRETLRRWLCDKFFNDHHLKRYKSRPIYWLFTSGRTKAFQCLVYLHRYNEGTLARMRAEYVIPLQGKMAARVEKLDGDIKAATSAAAEKRLQKEHDKLEKQLTELQAFDEKLRHYADRRITLDLDDGVKVNYGKFGSLLDQAKAIHGKRPEGP